MQHSQSKNLQIFVDDITPLAEQICKASLRLAAKMHVDEYAATENQELGYLSTASTVLTALAICKLNKGGQSA
jgi:hypothetical protein